MLSIGGMHTASDSTRRSGYTTRWFRTFANTLINAHKARGDLRGANFTLSVCLGHYSFSDGHIYLTNVFQRVFSENRCTDRENRDPRLLV